MTSNASVTARRLLVAAGLLFLAAAVALPDNWYDPLSPVDPVPPPPISGWLLLRVVLFVDAVLLVWCGLRGPTWSPVPDGGRLAGPEQPRATGAWAAGLVVVLLVGFGLRAYRLDSGLWLDEITPLVRYRDATAWQIVTSYVSSNNHLLNTLLVKLSVAAFGEEAWSARLPAMLLGVASLAAAYWTAREVMRPRESLLVALLLAVSYHHIFFSQNARGYTGYLVAALLAAVFLARGLRDDRPRYWAGYVAAILVGFAFQLITAFVLATHALVAATALRAIARRGGPVWPMARRVMFVMSIAAWLSLHLYVVVIPDAYAYAQTVYRDPAAGFQAFSLELLAEVARGLSAGVGTGLLALAPLAGAVALAGMWRFWRLNGILFAALAGPPLVQVGLSAVRGLVVSPRFMVLLLPVLVMSAVLATEWLASHVARLAGWRPARAATLGTAVVILAGVASVASLPRYYSTPKQAYGEALEWLADVREPGDVVLAVHYAVSGVRFYGVRMGWKDGQDFHSVRSVSDLDRVLSAHPDRPVWLVITFPRALHLNAPELERRLYEGWTRARVFQGTIGDGAVSIWRRQPRGTP